MITQGSTAGLPPQCHPLAVTTSQVSPTFDEIFKDNFYEQLQSINAILKRSIDTAGPYQGADWWKNLAEVRFQAVTAQSSAIQGHFVSLDNLQVAYVGSPNPCLDDLCSKLMLKAEHDKIYDDASCDLIVAPHTLYSEIEAIFNATEKLAVNPSVKHLQEHPLYELLNKLRPNGLMVITMNSGPNIQDFTNIMLEKHTLEFSKLFYSSALSLKVFNNAETFLRCLDIFKKHYEEICGKSLSCELSFSMPQIPLTSFCEGYAREFPELASLPESKRDQFVRLISVFTVDSNVSDCNLTLQLSVKEKNEELKRSFKPILDPRRFTRDTKEDKSNDISLGQLDLNQQIQNLSGSELSMPYIKDADGNPQYEFIKKLFNKSVIRMVDLGGGRGETNAIPKAMHDAGPAIRLLNVEPYQGFAHDYVLAHKEVGIEDVTVLQKKAQDLTVEDVTSHFDGEKVDLIFASHSLYFELGDMHKASLVSSQSIERHPLWKYIQMLSNDGIFLVTMQTGAGARLFRNALLGEHGLSSSLPVADETVSLLKSFGNIATALRHIEVFQERLFKETGKEIEVKMRYAMANVPLGGFSVSQDSITGGYSIHNPHGRDDDPNWFAPRMLDFYGNWKELEAVACACQDDQKRVTAQKTQSIFLHILRAFAPGLLNMQHPNITLEITLKKVLTIEN